MAQKKKKSYAMSRRRRITIITSCFILVALLICLDRAGLPGNRRVHSFGNSKSLPVDVSTYHCGTAKVINVVDGDTIDIDIPDGEKPYTRIRLWGVDTPETKSPTAGQMYFGPEAGRFTTRLAMGKEVKILLDPAKDTRGKYGRLLAYVKLPNGKILNELIISEGFGYADLRFDHCFYRSYQSLQRKARRQEKGFWKSVQRSQLPQWLQREKPQLLKEKHHRKHP